MGLLYSLSFAAVAVTVQQDFFEITAPSDCVVALHSFELTQSTDVGDAAAEGLQVLVKRGATTSGSGGSTPTAAPLEFGFPAAGSTCETNNTTKAVSGTIATLYASNWIIQQPFLYLPPPELRFHLSPSQRLTVELGTTPADSITCSGTLWFEEIGG